MTILLNMLNQFVKKKINTSYFILHYKTNMKLKMLSIV